MRGIVVANNNDRFLLDRLNRVNEHRLKVYFSFSFICFLMIVALFILSNLPPINQPPVSTAYPPLVYRISLNLVTAEPIIFSTTIFVCFFLVFSLFTLGFALSLINFGNLYIFPLKIVGVIPVASALSWTIIIHYGFSKITSFKVEDSDKKQWHALANQFLKNSATLDVIALILVWVGVVSEIISDTFWTENNFIAFFMDFGLFSWLMLSWLYFYVILTIKTMKQINYPRRNLIAFGLVILACVTYLFVFKKLRNYTLNNQDH